MQRLRLLIRDTRDRFLPADWRALRYVLALHVVLQLAGVAWDLPASFEWENDGVAPRDFFAGIALNLPPGHGHTYPLWHNLLLGLLNLPVLLVSVLTTPTWTPTAIATHILGYATMTPVYLVAKLLSVAMGVLALAALARVTARLWDRQAAIWAVLWAMANLSVAYYGRTGNLDGPYLCWMALAADALLDVVHAGDVRAYRRFAVLVALSVATKDQAYAAWVLPGPVLLVVWPLLRPTALAAGRDHWRRLLPAMGVGALTLGLAGGGLLNPPGFVARLHTLTGHASQDWRSYDHSLTGLWANLHDVALAVPDAWWPWPVAALAGVGVLLSLRHVALPRLLPLLLALSHLLFFTLVVARAGHRFTLPTGFWLAAYAGVATAAIFRVARLPARIAVEVVWLWALAQTLTVHVAQWTDARHTVEPWLAQLPAGTRVTTVGPVVSQPRWGLGALGQLRVTRLGPQPAEGRNPLPDVVERQGPWSDLLLDDPAVIVVPGPLLSEFTAHADTPGQQVQAVVAAHAADPGVAMMQAIARGDVPGHHVVRVPNQYPAWLTRLGLKQPHVHSSVGEDVVLVVRAGVPQPALQ